MSLKIKCPKCQKEFDPVKETKGAIQYEGEAFARATCCPAGTGGGLPGFITPELATKEPKLAECIIP